MHNPGRLCRAADIQFMASPPKLSKIFDALARRSPSFTAPFAKFTFSYSILAAHTFITHGALPKLFSIVSNFFLTIKISKSWEHCEEMT